MKWYLRVINFVFLSQLVLLALYLFDKDQSFLKYIEIIPTSELALTSGIIGAYVLGYMGYAMHHLNQITITLPKTCLEIVSSSVLAGANALCFSYTLINGYSETVLIYYACMTIVALCCFLSLVLILVGLALYKIDDTQRAANRAKELAQVNNRLLQILVRQD
jgi:hydrogenase maturation factor